MAWRPTEQLIAGELDNTVPGKVTGWLIFSGLEERVTLDLEGDFHRDIRRTKIRIRGEGQRDGATERMDGFAVEQKGQAGDITTGLPPSDYGEYPYIEWYSEENGRVVLELLPEQVEVIGVPLPASETPPVEPERSHRLLAEWLRDLSSSLGVPAFAVGVPAEDEKD